MVTRSIPSLDSTDELARFVYNTLCRDHELLPDAFPTSEATLRRGRDCECGKMFTLHGPRSVKLTAIWEQDQNRVLFYGPTGKRYLQVLLEAN
ncbi:MAG: hypothetical protein ACRC46_01945 [Thermoguttaceae bacterium]